MTKFSVSLVFIFIASFIFIVLRFRVWPRICCCCRAAEWQPRSSCHYYFLPGSYPSHWSRSRRSCPLAASYTCKPILVAGASSTPATSSAVHPLPHSSSAACATSPQSNVLLSPASCSACSHAAPYACSARTSSVNLLVRYFQDKHPYHTWL